jgi:hypothetical protein
MVTALERPVVIARGIASWPFGAQRWAMSELGAS